MEEIRKLLNHIGMTRTANDGGLTMAAHDEISFGQSLLADWDRGVSRNFSWEEFSRLSPISQEMVDYYDQAFTERFLGLAKTCSIVGMPSNCSIEQLEDLLGERGWGTLESLVFDFNSNEQWNARCYWEKRWNAETRIWETGCISCISA